MRRSNINLGGLSFLVADSNPHALSLVHGILRGFGVTKTTEVRDANSALQVLSDHCPDIFLCDAQLLPVGGLEFIRFIRHRPDLSFRAVPIFAMTSDTRVNEIRRARDCGVNMVLARPTSPSALYDRLVWIALNPRSYIDSPNYFGPDRRMGTEGEGSGRRKDDTDASAEDGTGPALTQAEIDALLKAGAK